MPSILNRSDTLDRSKWVQPWIEDPLDYYYDYLEIMGEGVYGQTVRSICSYWATTRITYQGLNEADALCKIMNHEEAREQCWINRVRSQKTSYESKLEGIRQLSITGRMKYRDVIES